MKNDMEKIDLIQQQNPRSLKYDSPDISRMFKLKIDDRTMFYFRTPEKRKAFIEKRYDRKLKKFNINSEY